MTEEEKENLWRTRWELPKPLDDRILNEQYEDKITNNGKIKKKKEEIMQGIEAIAHNIEEDKKLWQHSEEKKQLQIIRTDRGR